MCLGSPNSSSANLNGPSFFFCILTINCIAFSLFCMNLDFSQKFVFPPYITLGDPLGPIPWHFNQWNRSKSVCKAFSQFFLFFAKCTIIWMSKTRFLPLWLTKIGERRWFLSFHRSPTSHGKVRRENLYSEGLGVYKELIRQVGRSWDIWKCTIIWLSEPPFLVGCTRLYNPLCPSVGWSVGWSVTLYFFLWFYFFDLTDLPKWSSDLKYGPCPPARDWGSRVSGLVHLYANS